MSVKMVKNSTGGGDGPAVSPGRRTPLSLGPSSAKPNKQQTVDAIEITSNENKQVSSRMVIDLTTDSKNGSTLTSSTENSNSKEKSGQKKQENGQDDKKSNGHKNEKSRESSRQQKEVEISHKAEVIQKPNDIDVDIRLKPGPKSKKEKELRELKEKASGSPSPIPSAAKNDTNSAPSTPTKPSGNENSSKSPSKRPQRSAAIAANASILSMAADASVSSLGADKDLRGFGDEMGSLIYSDQTPMSISVADLITASPKDAIPTQIKTSNPSPKDAIPTQIKTSNPSPIKVSSEKENEKKKIESAKEENKRELTKKHLSEISVKSSCIPVPITSTPEGKRVPLTRPTSVTLRQISGRRSLHPSKDCSFQSQYRESYRKINTDLDYTNSSLNVTVGSELNANDSASSSFFFWGRRKREYTPPPTSSSATDILSVDSPKRARLDFGGFLGFVASPVTMLRAKLARTKIEVDINDVDGVENLDERNSAELNNDNLQDKENSNDKIEDEESDLSFKDNDDEQIDIEVINDKKNSSEVDDEDINESDDNIELNEEEPKRRCNVM